MNDQNFQKIICSTNFLPEILLPNKNGERFVEFKFFIGQQEEEMTRRVNGARSSSQSKTKRLEDLFRPPWEILFLGSFAEARDYAKNVNRWLLVNVQDSQEFACQILNRDVWPNSQIREIINDHFVLWQVLFNSYIFPRGSKN